MTTPRPWKSGIGNECHDIFDANGGKVCRVYHNLDDRFLIVKAVNQIDDPDMVLVRREDVKEALYVLSVVCREKFPRYEWASRLEAALLGEKP